MNGDQSIDAPQRHQYIVIPEQSAVLIRVSTSLGPLEFGAIGLEGFVTAAVRSDAVDLAVSPNAHLELQVRNLTSGNLAYDGELQRHIDARRHPAALVDLLGVHRQDNASRYLVTGQILFRGVTQVVEGQVEIDCAAPDLVQARGTTQLDIRSFEVPTPTAFMLKIKPEVTVSLQLQARRSP